MERRAFLQAALAAATAACGSPVKRQPIDEAATLMEQAVSGGRVRSASLLARRDDFEFARAFGEADSPDAIFLIASITKPMSVTGVMKLVDRGEVGLEDPVQRYIPEFSENGRGRITVKHLLTHTSGLPDQLPENVELRKRQAPLEEFVERAIRTPLLFEPGTKYSYQSMGILLASEIVQRVTETPFPEFLAREVFQPLGMTRTALGLGPFSIEDTELSQVEEAPGLYGGGEDTSSWNWNSPYWRNLGAPWGGAHSSAPDIGRFLAYFLDPDDRALKPETARSMIHNHNEGRNEPFGLGFQVKPGAFGKHCSGKTFGHSGATGTIAWCDPRTRLICVALTTLPARVSNELLLRPVCDKVSEAGV